MTGREAMRRVGRENWDRRSWFADVPPAASSVILSQALAMLAVIVIVPFTECCTSHQSLGGQSIIGSTESPVNDTDHAPALVIQVFQT